MCKLTKNLPKKNSWISQGAVVGFSEFRGEMIFFWGWTPEK